MPFNRIPACFDIQGTVAAASFLSEEMDTAFSDAYLGSIRFFNAAGAQVTPSAGTVTFTMTPDDINYQDVRDGVFNAADAYLPSRMMPYAQGPAVRARITLAGVTGAASFRATVSRY
jgi:hypothetical protein